MGIGYHVGIIPNTQYPQKKWVLMYDSTNVLFSEKLNVTIKPYISIKAKGRRNIKKLHPFKMIIVVKRRLDAFFFSILLLATPTANTDLTEFLLFLINNINETSKTIDKT